MIKKYTLNYFQNFSDKNLSELEKTFSNDIILKDWNILAKGKENVLKEISNVFNCFKTINVKVINFYQFDKTTISKLDILFDNKEMIEVVDIIKFDQSYNIKSIQAFKG